MNNNEMKEFIEYARISKGYSQREISKIIGLSQSTYNDTINGKIKKIDVDILRKIAEGLDLSLNELLKKAGYNDFYNFISKEKYPNKSTKELKELLEGYLSFKNDILDFDANKRKITTDARKKLFLVIEELKKIENGDDTVCDTKKLIEETQKAFDILRKVEEKYDYSKLPKE